MSRVLTKVYVLGQLECWRTTGELLSLSGNGGNEKEEKSLGKMLGKLEESGRIFSFPRGKDDTPNYILRRRLSEEQIDFYEDWKNRRAA
jgi:Ser/Thr protein kinase RdoA (MazF antagonist)